MTPACLNGMHITSSNVMSLTINYAYWVRECAQYASEYCTAVTNASLHLGYRLYSRYASGPFFKNTGSPYARTFQCTIFDRIFPLFSTGCILLVLYF